MDEQATTPPAKKSSGRSMKIGIVAVIIIVLAVGVYAFMSSSSLNGSGIGTDNKSISEAVSAQGNKTEVQKINDSLALLLPDGTYEKDVTYAYHLGTETIDIKLSVQNDIVTGASITSVGTPNPISNRFITGVNAALPDLVVGKQIDQLNIPHQVSGSSLTTAAFKQYVDSLITK